MATASLPAFSQDQRLERLALQHRLTQNPPPDERLRLTLRVIDGYINEGEYQQAVNELAKMKPDSVYPNEKMFLEGKAEYLADNYAGSLALMSRVNDAAILKEYYWDLQLFKLLSYNYLMLTDSLYHGLSQLYLQKNSDTAGLYSEIRRLRPPEFINVRKAARRSRILPGAGLFYVKEKKHGAASAFINFAFLGYTGYSIYTRHYITAALTGLGQFVRFYNGSKRAAVKIGVKKNRQAYIDYILQINSFTQKKVLWLSGFN